MPRGSKQGYSSKHKRIASKLEQRAKLKGRSTKTAERVAGATVKKQTEGRKRRTTK